MSVRYKPHCTKRCLLGGCETRDAGGCYCVCRMVDHLDTLHDLLEGTCFRKGGVIVYIPGRVAEPLSEEEKEKIHKEIEKVKADLKPWEILDERSRS